MPDFALPVTTVATRLPLASRQSGFTLAELAVVLVIVSLLLGGLLVPLSAQVDVRNTNDTRKAMAEIREALLGFAVVNSRLPCPAPPTTASGANGAGLEVPPIPTGCIEVAGVLPWATLGVDETDAWGRRYSYRVTRAFTHPVPPTNNGFSLSSVSDITVLSSAGGVAVAAGVPAIVVSHGKNGNGAYTPQGTQLPPGGGDEVENQLLALSSGTWKDDGVDKTFVKRSAPTPTYDDEVVWIPPGVLFNRMITAGKLP